MQLLGFDLCGNLTHPHTSHAIPVRQAKGLPPAFFRFHLTVSTLALGYALPLPGVLGTFTHKKYAMLGAPQKTVATLGRNGFAHNL
ncbi:hypothetical protein HMPREF1248_1482 [Coriobacteriaceae bacterium BV3Ac1]|uniref:hypothetical protein n=1 Tax=Olegusella massiliensis TaxID=1776381 RepID=UPI0003AE666B|nr:hypothetical protein [Olegusella massiliensis]ERL12650.1 hypothetical protein HMPREF1248_1482 [Coriobacteriaceae bacterium BV3Ac1]MBS5865461.1 hypothetical protein [Coriobacteriaceae bacterium]